MFFIRLLGDSVAALVPSWMMTGASNFDVSKPTHSTSLVTLYYILQEYRFRSGARSEECAGLLRQAPLRVDELEEVDAVDGGHVGTLGRQHRVLQQRVRQLAKVVHKLDGLKNDSRKVCAFYEPMCSTVFE